MRFLRLEVITFFALTTFWKLTRFAPEYCNFQVAELLTCVVAHDLHFLIKSRTKVLFACIITIACLTELICCGQVNPFKSRTWLHHDLSIILFPSVAIPVDSERVNRTSLRRQILHSKSKSNLIKIDYFIACLGSQ